MSAMERMTYRGSQGSNALTLEDPRSDSQDVPHRSESSTDFTSDDSIPLRLSDLREPAAPPKTLDAEMLAALTTRAKNLLAFGDIAGARLLLERAASAQDATAAFLLAQTYDPTVLGVRDTRSITADPVKARDWYRKADSFGSVKAQQRLIQIQN